MPEGSPRTRTRPHPQAKARTRTNTKTQSKYPSRTTSTPPESAEESGADQADRLRRVGEASQERSEEAAPLTDESVRGQYAEIVLAAERLVAGGADWQTFFREILGVDGLMRRRFKDAKLLARFEKSPEFDQIQIMFAQLRLKDVPPERVEPTKMITVRLPISLHKALRDEATNRATSLNKLCITKLLQVIDEQVNPGEATSAEDSPGKEASEIVEPGEVDPE
jgi:predicted HicB family RNase H-like nuclease